MGGFAFGRPGEIYRGTRYVVTRRTRAGLPVVVKAVRPEYPDLAAAHARLAHEHALLVDLRLPGIVRVEGLEDADGGAALVLEDAGPADAEAVAGPAAAVPRALPGPRHRPGRGARPPARAQHPPPRHQPHQRRHRRRRAGHPHRLRRRHRDRRAGPAHGGARPTGGRRWPTCSPEETGRVGRLVDGRADLYSLGATFYEMLTGAPPFVTNDPVELVHAHLARTPLPPAQANPAVPALLSDLVLKLLAKMPEARYQSAEALLADLREARAAPAPPRAPSPASSWGWPTWPTSCPCPTRSTSASWSAPPCWAPGIGPPPAIASWWSSAGRPGWASRRWRPSCAGRSPAATGGCSLGKCEVRRSSTPYAPLVQALQQLVTSLRSEPEEQAARTARQRLREALGSNARVVTELCPPSWRRARVQAPPLARAGPARDREPLRAGPARLRARRWPAPSARWCC